MGISIRKTPQGLNGHVNCSSSVDLTKHDMVIYGDMMEYNRIFDDL